MLVVSHSVLLEAAPERVWRKLVDWKDWPSWDTGQEKIEFDGPINAGSVGKLKLKGGPEVALKIVDFSPGKSYVSEFKLLGARFVFGHSIVSKAKNLTVLTVVVEMKGLSALLWAGLMCASLRKDVPQWMQNFKSTL